MSALPEPPSYPPNLDQIEYYLLDTANRFPGETPNFYRLKLVVWLKYSLGLMLANDVATRSVKDLFDCCIARRCVNVPLVKGSYCPTCVKYGAQN